MPWKECHVMDERVRFVARLLDGEKTARVCEEFGISRKTGYKIFDRYKDTGIRGLTDRSRRPYRHANQLPITVEKPIRPSSESAYGSGGRTSAVRRSVWRMRCSPVRPVRRRRRHWSWTSQL